MHLRQDSGFSLDSWRGRRMFVSASDMSSISVFPHVATSLSPARCAVSVLWLDSSRLIINRIYDCWYTGAIPRTARQPSETGDTGKGAT